jgi:hypothetical protein
MVLPLLVIGAAVGAGSAILSGSKANRNKLKAYKKQVENITRNYSYGINELDKQQTQAYHQAVSELYELSLNGMQNNASVEVAMAESGAEGRTTNQVKRGLNGALQRQSRAIKDNHEQTVANVISQKNALRIETNAQYKAAKEQTDATLTTGLAAVMQTINGAAIGAATAWAGGAIGGALAGTAGGAASTAASTTASATASTAASTTASTAASTTASTGLGSFFSNMGSSALSTYSNLNKYMTLIQGMGQLTASFQRRT